MPPRGCRCCGSVGDPTTPDAPAAAVAPTAGSAPELAEPAANPEIMAHIQRMGDVGCKLGEWLGAKGSRQWVEGFGMAPVDGVAAEDIEYQAVLGRNWLSPWVEGGKFCGSRGMALPLLGLKVRLKGAAAKTYECSYSATFVDGSEVGPVNGGETCEAESLAALEAFQIVIQPRSGGKTAAKSPAARIEVTPVASAKTPARPTTGRRPRKLGLGGQDASPPAPSWCRRHAPVSRAVRSTEGQQIEVPVRSSELSRAVPAHRAAPCRCEAARGGVHQRTERQRDPRRPQGALCPSGTGQQGHPHRRPRELENGVRRAERSTGPRLA